MSRTPGAATVRPFLKVEPFVWMSTAEILSRPDREQLALAAAGVIRSDVKAALHGLAPIYGKESLLAMCAAVIDEDFDPDGPQTPFTELGEL